MRYGILTRAGAASVVGFGLMGQAARAQNQGGEPPLPPTQCLSDQSGTSFDGVGHFVWGLEEGDFTLDYSGRDGGGRIVIHNFNSASGKVTMDEKPLPSAAGSRARVFAHQLLALCKSRGPKPG